MSPDSPPGTPGRNWVRLAMLIAAVAIAALSFLAWVQAASIQDLVEEDRCRDRERDAFLEEVGHLIEREVPGVSTGPPEETSFGEAVDRIENIEATCGDGETSDDPDG